jgi:hypothetical protein
MRFPSAIFILLMFVGCAAPVSKPARPSLARLVHMSAAEPQLVTLPYATITRVATDVDLQWPAAEGAAAYNIFYGIDPDDWEALIHVGDITNCTLPGLVSGTTYYVRATVEDEDGTASDFSEVCIVSLPLWLDLTFSPPVESLQSSTDLVVWQDCPAVQNANGTWRVTPDPFVPRTFYRASPPL